MFQTNPPIIDLHCDLLWYLSLDEKRTANDPQSRCAIPQLREGGIKLQTMAIFTETNSMALESSRRQADIFQKLPAIYPGVFQHAKDWDETQFLEQTHLIGIIPAIENASGICSEEEELFCALERFTTLQKKIGKALYVSLTWNTENRFGGGALTKVGLKNDGKQLLEYLSQKGIAIDLSHASDYLAYDVLNEVEKKGLQLAVMASHSNMRSLADVPRNLPDEIAKQIIRKGGIIGLNFIRYFLGSEVPESFCRQLEHILKLGGEHSLSFGADFFCIEDLPPHLQKPLDVLFFPSFNHAGCYGKVLEMCRNVLSLSESSLRNMCYGNFFRFIHSS